jgi:hypothetical protein
VATYNNEVVGTRLATAPWPGVPSE